MAKITTIIYNIEDFKGRGYAYSTKQLCIKIFFQTFDSRYVFYLELCSNFINSKGVLPLFFLNKREKWALSKYPN